MRILETALYGADLTAASRFYVGVLGLEFDSEEPGRHVFFRCGDQMLLFFDPASTEVGGGPVPTHGARGPGHAAFAVANERELDDWRARLVEHDVEIEAEMEWPRGGRSLYFRDPAGNSIELTTAGIWGIEARNT